MTTHDDDDDASRDMIFDRKKLRRDFDAWSKIPGNVEKWAAACEN